MLINLNSIANRQGEFEQAERDGLEGLELARQGRYNEAEAYLQEALSLARQVGDIWLLSAILNERGDLYLKQQRLDEAHAAFSESLAISAEGSQEEVASALYGLARVAARKGDLTEARRLGRKCLDNLEPMGNRLKDTVRVWLGSIPEDES